MDKLLHKLGEFSFIACPLFGFLAFLSFIFGVSENIITMNFLLFIIRLPLIDILLFMFFLSLLLIPLMKLFVEK